MSESVMEDTLDYVVEYFTLLAIYCHLNWFSVARRDNTASIVFGISRIDVSLDIDDPDDQDKSVITYRTGVNSPVNLTGDQLEDMVMNRSFTD